MEDQHGYQRRDVAFSSDGETCRGWLYLPDGVTSAPLVIMAHGFSAERTFRLPAYAERFAQAGLAVLLFDYRNFGDSDGTPRFLVDPARHVDDWRQALAFARTLPEIDTARIALWGSSFSGGHVITLAAEDPGVRAIVAQVPYVGGIEVKLSLGNTLKAAGSIIGDKIAALFGGAVTVPIVGPQGSFACMASSEAMQFLDIVDEASDWNNRIPARALVTLGAYQPRDVADRVACPALVVVGETDETTPPDLARAAAARMPKAQVAAFNAGHFEVYMEPLFEDVVTQQTEFLMRHLAG